jgi:hypothetical protein
LEVRNPLLVGVWFLLMDLVSPQSERARDRWGTLSCFWRVGGVVAVAWSGSQYLPGRYLVHWIVPATIHVMAGLSLHARDTFTRIAATLRERRGWVQAGIACMACTTERDLHIRRGSRGGRILRLGPIQACRGAWPSSC